MLSLCPSSTPKLFLFIASGCPDSHLFWTIIKPSIFPIIYSRIRLGPVSRAAVLLPISRFHPIIYFHNMPAASSVHSMLPLKLFFHGFSSNSLTFQKCFLKLKDIFFNHFLPSSHLPLLLSSPLHPFLTHWIPFLSKGKTNMPS